MFLPKKMKRSRMTSEEAKAIMERAKTEAPLELEKGDLTAMILAAFVVFMPVVLLFCGALYFAYWFLFNVWGG
jgi:uncharacterized membrane protein